MQCIVSLLRGSSYARSSWIHLSSIDAFVGSDSRLSNNYSGTGIYRKAVNVYGMRLEPGSASDCAHTSGWLRSANSAFATFSPGKSTRGRGSYSHQQIAEDGRKTCYAHPTAPLTLFDWTYHAPNSYGIMDFLVQIMAVLSEMQGSKYINGTAAGCKFVGAC